MRGFSCERRLRVAQERATAANRGMPLVPTVTGVNTERHGPGFEMIVNRGDYWSFFLQLGHRWCCIALESGKDDVWVRLRLTIWRADLTFQWWTKAAF